MKISNKSRWMMSVCGAVAGLAAVAGPACAQTQSPAPVVTSEAQAVEEVVVTAQKRQQNIEDVPVAITAVGSGAIKAIGHQDVTALVDHVPGLLVQQFSPTTVAFNIRGVSQNDFADSQEAPIAFYNDEVYVSAMSAISGQNYDLERIEVLRGPQGTLFGRNATGGLVQYITAKPTGSFQGFATLTAGSHGEIGSEAAVSGPLANGIRGRLSFSSDNYDGYIKNLIGPDLGSRRFYAGRAQLEADVGATGLLRVKIQAMRNDHESSAPYTWLSSQPNADGLGVPTPGQPDNLGYLKPTNNPFVAQFDNVPSFSRTYWSGTARYEQDLTPGIRLTSITDYEHIRKDYGEDSDGTPFAGFNYYQHQDLWQASEELRLSGKFDRQTWVVGLYGLDIHSNAHAIINAPFFGTDLSAGGPQRTTSFAVFGQDDYEVSDVLTVTLGARYSYDKKVDNYTHVLNGAVDDTFNTSNSSLATQVYENWSGKAGVEYRPAKGVLLYVSANRGTKSGGFDIPNFLATDAQGNYLNDTIPYKQEVLVNYEGGFKITTFDRLVDLNGSVFHYDYSNYQAFIIQGLTAVIRNLPAKVTGGEFEVNARPISGLNLGAFVTYLDTQVIGVTLPSGRVTDRVMPQAPMWSVGWNGSYKMSLGQGQLALSTDWRYDDRSYFSTFNAPIDLEPAHIIGNVQLSYSLNAWTASLNVSNVTDKSYRVYDLDNSPTLGSAQATFAHPRWVTASIGYRF
jgi:iron complex outermembrane receptor protein